MKVVETLKYDGSITTPVMVKEKFGEDPIKLDSIGFYIETKDGEKRLDDGDHIVKYDDGTFGVLKRDCTNTIDLQQKKAEKNGEITVARLLERSLENADDLKRIVTIAIDKNGYVLTGWNHGGTLEALGMLEAAKVQILNDMEE